MRVLILTLILCSSTLFSCGGSSGRGKPRSNPGPSSCLASSSSEFVHSFQTADNPFKLKYMTSIGQINLSNQIKFNIVGGTIVNNTIYPANTNTVALLLDIPNNSSSKIICSGTVVADNLILTAAHCFDSVDLNSTSPGQVIFSNTLSSGNLIAISCWQRNLNYISCKEDSSYNCVLNDIAWVKINGSVSTLGYSPVAILSNPQAISTNETKWMAGFGMLNDNVSNSSGSKYVVDTSLQGHPDVEVSSQISLFDSGTFSGAYENYLTVVGPYSGHGTCEGDSGGPLYLFRNSNYILAALTQGSDNVLSPKPIGSYPFTFDTSNLATCNDGYGVYTTVGNYINWITTTSGVGISTY